MTTFNAGDRVLIDHNRTPGVHIVVEKLQKNYRVRAENGTTFRCAPALMTLVPADGSVPLGRPFVPIAIFHPGQTVKLRGKTDVFVVTKSTPRGYSVAKLGGDNGRYWNADARNLTAVEITFEEKS